MVDENEKQTPLMLAADFGYLDTVKALLKAGADVNFVSPYGQTALSYALIGRSRSLEVLKKMFHILMNIILVGICMFIVLVLLFGTI